MIKNFGDLIQPSDSPYENLLFQGFSITVNGKARISS